MKRIIKRILKGLWNSTSFLRRPLMARFDAHLSAVIAGTVNARMMPTLVEALAISGRRLERIEATLERAEDSADSLATEMDLVMNGLSREVFRLQAQVERLELELLDPSRIGGTGLSIVDESREESGSRRVGVVERSRVG
ncbi:hypothetical protein P12x_003624 [Tundrisphaera lichenicola]|uniref:hypothetical protein n=1 Tax=Tundrisphaera lichenicola TaxID=2029860 RepID=UPI003EC0603D